MIVGTANEVKLVPRLGSKRSTASQRGRGRRAYFVAYEPYRALYPTLWETNPR